MRMVACRGYRLVDLAGAGHVEAAGHLDTVWRSLGRSLRGQLLTTGADSDRLDGGKKFGVSGAGDTRRGMLRILLLLTSHTKHV